MSLAMVNDVAKRKAKSAPEPEATERKPMAVQVRASAEWKAWAEKLARFDGIPLAGVVDRALRRYAREIGFKDEAPSR